MTAQAKGKITPSHAAHTQAACLLQERLAYLSKTEAERADSLTLEQRLALSREIRAILADRNKAIDALKLGDHVRDLRAEVDAARVAIQAEKHRGSEA